MKKYILDRVKGIVIITCFYSLYGFLLGCMITTNQVLWSIVFGIIMFICIIIVGKLYGDILNTLDTAQSK
jgi:uncharacterized membrane protein (DUF485 family)